MSREFKIGLILVCSIGLLVFGINFLKGKNIFKENHTFVAVYDHVDGLVNSSPVTYKGLKVGSVKSVLLNPETGNIDVKLNIQNRRLSLPKGSIARITSSDLLGSKAVVLFLGNSTEILHAGDTLETEIEEGLKDAVNQQIAPIKNKAENLISSIDSVFTVVNSILNDGSVGDIQRGVKSLSKTLQAFASTAKRIDTLVRSQKSTIEKTLEHLESATSIMEDKKPQISNTIDNISEISDSLASSNLPAALKAFEKSLMDASVMLESINQGDGSLGKLLKTDSLHNAVMRNMNDMEALLEDMKANPNRYVHFSIFGKKDKGVNLTPRQEKKLNKILEEN